MAEAPGKATKRKEEELQIAVIDLNQTFYNKSSKEELYKFILTKEPKRLKFIFEMAYFKLLDKINILTNTEFKENFFNYLDRLPPDKLKSYAAEFWQQEYPKNFNMELQKRLEQLKKKNVKIICATGGLENYVKPLFDLYQIDGLVGTRVKYTGKTYVIEGEACSGDEKIRRIDQLLNSRKYTILEAYSDKKETILEKAVNGFLVKDGAIKPLENK